MTKHPHQKTYERIFKLRIPVYYSYIDKEYNLIKICKGEVIIRKGKIKCLIYVSDKSIRYMLIKDIDDFKKFIYNNKSKSYCEYKITNNKINNMKDISIKFEDNEASLIYHFFKSMETRIIAVKYGGNNK